MFFQEHLKIIALGGQVKTVYELRMFSLKKTWEDQRAVLRPGRAVLGKEGDLLCAAPKVELGSEGGCESKGNVLQVELSKDKGCASSSSVELFHQQPLLGIS